MASSNYNLDLIYFSRLLPGFSDVQTNSLKSLIENLERENKKLFKQSNQQSQRIEELEYENATLTVSIII